MSHSAHRDEPTVPSEAMSESGDGRAARRPRHRMRVRWSTLAMVGLGSSAILLTALTIGLGILPASEAVPEAVVPDAAVEAAPEAVAALPDPVVEPVPEALPASPPPTSSPPSGTLVDEGVASTYGVGDDFQGRTTACGQTFDTNFPQAAHKTLPCGALIRVVDEESGRAVITKVTDRGPFTPGRVVDLSMAAYRQLDPRGEPGLLDVRVYRLPPGGESG